MTYRESENLANHVHIPGVERRPGRKTQGSQREPLCFGQRPDALQAQASIGFNAMAAGKEIAASEYVLGAQKPD